MSNYYKETVKGENRVFDVISLEAYKMRLFEDAPDMKALIDWDFLQSQSCYSNALFLCYFNEKFNFFADEWLDYCEGVIINRIAIAKNDATAIHHSWIYSNKYNCYVDCTPTISPAIYKYYLSDTLKDYDLVQYIESIIDKDGISQPRFIHNDIPLGEPLS